MPDTTSLGQYGIAGALVGLTILASWKLLDYVLKSRDTDVTWYRQELKDKRTEYLLSIKQNQEEYVRELKTIASSFNSSIEALCERMEHMEQRIESAIRDISNPILRGKT